MNPPFLLALQPGALPALSPRSRPHQPLLRPADPYDGATPSGASAIAEALLTAAHLAGVERYLQAAGNTLQAHSVLLARAPSA